MDTLSVDDLAISHSSGGDSTYSSSKKDLKVHKSLISSKSSPSLNDSFNKRHSSSKLFKNISSDYLNSPPYMNPHKALIDLYRKFSTKKGSSQTNAFDIKKRKMKKLEDIYNYCNKENTFIVTIRKNNRGLGLSIYGGIDAPKDNSFSKLIRILNLHPLQPALECGKLALGDVILEVNGTSMLGLTKTDAVDVLRNAPADVVLKIFRPPKCFVPSFSTFKESLSSNDKCFFDNARVSSEDMPCFAESEIFEVALAKQDGCLGFTILYKDSAKDTTGGIYIKNLTRKHAISDGRIQPGDRILQVNETDVSDFNQSDALACLRNAPKIVKLKLHRSQKMTDSSKNETVTKVHTFNVILKTNRDESLGFFICDPGIQKNSTELLPCAPEIKFVDPGSVADKNGIKLGDRILEVNGESFINKTNIEANNFLRRNWGELKIVCCRLQHEEKETISNEKVHPFNIILEKSQNENLGFSICDSDNRKISSIFPWAPEIKTVNPGGLADRNGMQLGDRILEVNGESLIDKTADEANNILSQIDENIKIVCCRVEPEKKETIKKIQLHTFNAMLETRPNESVGFSVCDAEDSLPCAPKVNTVYPGGLADKNGMQIGDRILEVNGENLIDKTADEAINIIRQTIGDIRFVCCRLQQESRDSDSER